MRPLSSRTRTMLSAGIVVAVLACVAAIFSIPPDEKLGKMVRFVMYHGASTWVNMATFTVAGVLGVLFLVGKRDVRPWGEAFRWVSLPLWIVNSVLGVVSMQLLWGGILWSEPRLAMTFGILGGALVIFAVQLIFDAPRVTAALDALLAATLWTLVLVLPNLFHPDSPVFSSGNFAYIGGFFGMVLSIAVVVTAIAVFVARRPEATPR